jgi:hypothetical protein
MSRVAVRITFIAVTAFGLAAITAAAPGETTGQPQASLAMESQTDALQADARDDVEAWIAEHGLPVDWLDLLAVPPEMRRRVYSELSAETQSFIWQSRLSYILELPHWNAGQTDVLLDMLQLTSPDFFAAPENYRPELDALQTQAAEVFSPDELRAIVASIDVIQPDNSVADDDSLLSDALAQSLAAEGGLRGDVPTVPDCECSQDAPFCPYPKICERNPPPCYYSLMGCGWFWVLPCDGMCISVG